MTDPDCTSPSRAFAAQGTAHSSVRQCPGCGQGQSGVLPFCLDCGESIQLGSAIDERRAPERPGFDVIVGAIVLLLVLVLLFASAS